MKNKKIRCDIYTRVSTTMQIDGYSLDAQKESHRSSLPFKNGYKKSTSEEMLFLKISFLF